MKPLKKQNKKLMKSRLNGLQQAESMFEKAKEPTLPIALLAKEAPFSRNKLFSLQNRIRKISDQAL